MLLWFSRLNSAFSLKILTIEGNVQRGGDACEEKRVWVNSFILDLFDFRMHNFNDFSFNILTTSTPVSQIMRDQRNADERALYYKPHITKRFSVRSNAAQKRETRTLDAILF